MKLALVALCLLAAPFAPAQFRPKPTETPQPLLAKSTARWAVQYFYDENDSTLDIIDLKFPSAQRGFAAGQLVEKGKAKPVGLVTSDGGAKWETIPLKEEPRAVFFLDESQGWMATDRGIWKTEESGRGWKKLASMKGLLHVFFTSAERGYAVGYPKAVYETNDGGKKWSKLPAAAKPNGSPEYTTYQFIDFATARVGMITGAIRPPRRNVSPLPSWMDPEGFKRRTQWPNLNIVLQTQDGGANWRADTVSTFGTISRVSLSKDARGLLLIEFLDSFDFPAEIHQLDLHTGKSSLVFRRKDRAVTDVAIMPYGAAYLAAVEPPGSLLHSPVPGKLKMIKSDDLQLWQEMEVDYRATATRAIMATAGPDNIWVATDTGMILKLVK